MKRLLAESANLGARLSFREVPSGASNETVAEVVATIVDAWRNNGANHVTVIASEETIVRILHVVRKILQRHVRPIRQAKLFSRNTQDICSGLTL